MSEKFHIGQEVFISPKGKKRYKGKIVDVYFRSDLGARGYEYRIQPMPIEEIGTCIFTEEVLIKYN